jgi:purine nucleosidase
MATYVKGRGGIGDYLYTIFEDFTPDHFGRSKVIWDISAPAWLLSGSWVSTVLMPSPVLTDEVTWGAVDTSRHMVRIARHIDRDAVFTDLFVKLAEHAKAGS